MYEKSVESVEGADNSVLNSLRKKGLVYRKEQTKESVKLIKENPKQGNSTENKPLLRSSPEKDKINLPTFNSQRMFETKKKVLIKKK